MKKKYLFFVPAMTMAMSTSAFSQDVHPGLKNVADNINTKAEHVEMNKIDGDIASLIKYANMAIDIARKEGQPVPKDLNVEGLLKAFGVLDFKAYGVSSNEEDNAWVSHMFYDNGGSTSGLYSILGGKATAFSVPSMAPAGTDLALQLKLDLSQLEGMIKDVIKNADSNYMGQLEGALKTDIEHLGMNVSDLLAKSKVTLNLAIDLDEKEAIPTPLGAVGKPNIVGRIDGLAWIWDKVKDDLFADVPFEMNEKEENGVITYTVPEEVAAQLLGYDPVIVVDKKANQIWLASSVDFLAKCTSGENTLADSAEFKAALAGLPSKGNSLAYFSKSFLKELSKKYKAAADTGIFGEEFEKGKAIADALVEDLTESDHGHAYVISQNDKGLKLSARTFFGAKHLKWLQSLAPMLQQMEAQKMMQERMRPRRRGNTL